MLSLTTRLPLACLVVLGLLSACGDVPPADPPAASASGPLATTTTTTTARPAPSRSPEPMPGGGLRIDHRGEGRHVRGLQRQPDGTYKSVCVDAPDALRPRATSGATP